MQAISKIVNPIDVRGEGGNTNRETHSHVKHLIKNLQEQEEIRKLMRQPYSSPSLPVVQREIYSPRANSSFVDAVTSPIPQGNAFSGDKEIIISNQNSVTENETLVQSVDNLGVQNVERDSQVEDEPANEKFFEEAKNNSNPHIVETEANKLYQSDPSLDVAQKHSNDASTQYEEFLTEE